MQHPIEFLRTKPHYHPDASPPRDVGRVSPMFGKQWSEDIDFMLIDRAFTLLAYSKAGDEGCPGGVELDELFQTVSKSWWKATSRWIYSTSASSQSDRTRWASLSRLSQSSVLSPWILGRHMFCDLSFHDNARVITRRAVYLARCFAWCIL